MGMAEMNEPIDELALKLILARRTLVLSVADPDPWSAPVYYVYGKGRFYFFSAAESRHAAAAMSSGHAAGSIYRDSDDWREIEGLQMAGRVEQIGLGVEALHAFTSYVMRFPTVKEFFASTSVDLEQFIQRFRCRLYAFIAEQAFYLNNARGFAKRTEIRLP
jgi:uncharacterized protein YhbP (UPF0306 family)